MTDTAIAPPTAPHADKWPRASATPIVEAFHTAIRKRMAEKFAASGKDWKDFVHDQSQYMTAADFEAVEAELLATGYRFEMSAIVSVTEDPDKYKPVEGAGGAASGETDDQGRPVVGSGDNVFKAPADVEGNAVFVSTVEKVMDLLTGGVPADTIAVIDDSGGTLTAPILGEFKAVLCMGGTVRSHLGILTREFNVPCLMAVTLEGLSDGDRISVEYSKPAADAYADEATAAAQRARIVKLS